MSLIDELRAQGMDIGEPIPRTWVSHARDSENSGLERLIGLTVTAVEPGAGDESPALIFEGGSEIFPEKLRLSKRHEFDGPNVRSFYVIEDVV